MIRSSLITWKEEEEEKKRRNVIAIDQSYKRETSEYERESNLHHQLAI
jgi:hypothetical protein